MAEPASLTDALMSITQTLVNDPKIIGFALDQVRLNISRIDDQLLVMIDQKGYPAVSMMVGEIEASLKKVEDSLESLQTVPALAQAVGTVRRALWLLKWRIWLYEHRTEVYIGAGLVGGLLILAVATR